jgi:hypothetical protein
MQDFVVMMTILHGEERHFVFNIFLDATDRYYLKREPFV